MKKYLGGKIGPGGIGPEAAPTSSTAPKTASVAGGVYALGAMGATGPSIPERG